MLPILLASFTIAAPAAEAQEPRQLAESTQEVVLQVTALQGELPVVDPADPRAALGGTPVDEAPLTAQGTFVPPIDEPGLYDLTLTGTGTEWVEDFLLYVPGIAPPAEVPLLVVFHQGNSSHRDVQFNTSYIAEAEARGWYLLAPLGATQINFSSLDSQVNTKFVLDWTLDNFNVDLSRIYGVGFSMGGGNALNYAARHLDPERAMFAAIANHSGTASLTGTYSVDPTSRFFLEILFEGTPAENLFDYQRCSVLDLDSKGEVVPGTNMAVNLAHVPIQTWYATNDPVAYLLDQSDALHGFLTGIGAPHELIVIPWIAHNWWILEETTVCNWLDAQVLAIPAQGQALVDRSGPYFHLDVQQTVAGAFTRFDWAVDGQANRLELGGSENLGRATLATVAAGLDPTAELEVVLSSLEAGGDELGLTGYALAPSEVLRDGVAVGTWTFDGGSGTVVLQESDPAEHVWTVRP